MARSKPATEKGMRKGTCVRVCVREWPDTCGYTPYPTRAHVRAHTCRRITIMGEH